MSLAVLESHRIARRGELAALLRLALPLVGANLMQMAVSAIDVIFVARLGPVDLAAATLGVFLFNLLMFGLIGLASAAAPLIAAELGRQKHAVREVRRSVRMALWVGLAGAVPVVILLWQGNVLLRLAGQDPVVAERAGAFLRILAIGIVPGVAAGVLRVTAAALGRPGWAFLATGLALLVDAVGNWLLVFGHGGFPALGIRGSAIASVACLTAMLGCYAIVFAADRRLRRYRLFGRWWRTDWPRAGEIVRIGLPIALTWLFEGALFGGAAILMGLIGVVEVAAHAIALNIAAVSFQLPYGIAQAATIRVGLAYGARDRMWIGRAGNVALGLGIGIMVVTAAVMWLVPRALVSVYVDPDAAANAAEVALAIQFLTIAAVFQLVDGAQAVAAGVLRGLQDTRVPMLMALFGYWVVGFVVAVWLGFRTPLKGVGIWWGLAVGLAVVAALLLGRWVRRQPLGLTVAAA